MMVLSLNEKEEIVSCLLDDFCPEVLSKLAKNDYDINFIDSLNMHIRVSYLFELSNDYDVVDEANKIIDLLRERLKS